MRLGWVKPELPWSCAIALLAVVKVLSIRAQILSNLFEHGMCCSLTNSPRPNKELRWSVLSKGRVDVRSRRSVLMAIQKIDPRQPDSTDVEVGHLVRVQRMERGLSQTECGTKVQFNPRTISRDLGLSCKTALPFCHTMRRATRVRLCEGFRMTAQATRYRREAHGAMPASGTGRTCLLVRAKVR